MTAGCAESLRVLIQPGNVAELRIPKAGSKGVVSGYFDDMMKMGAAAERWSGRVPGVYTTLNPVRPDLLARSANHVVEHAQFATSDTDIVKRVWLPIDFDVVRPAGISSTNADHEAALGQARLCRQFLRGQGWPDPIYADSGNGGHLDYRIDLPTESNLVQRVLQFLATKFNGAGVHVDEAVYNSARIWKLYGTRACKGDSTAERPHRVSAIIECPNPLVIVTTAQLENLIGPEAKAEAKPGRPYEVHREFSLDDWLAKYQHRLPPLGIKRPFAGGGWKREFDYCPWNADHTTTSAFVGTKANGAIVAGCLHNSCQDKYWDDLKSVVGDTVTGTHRSKSNGQATELSEDRLALRFTDRHPDLRYTAAWHKWHIATKQKWEEDKVLQVFDLAREICREAGKEDKRLGSAKTRWAVVNMAQEHRQHRMLASKWDSDNWILNTPGGVVDLRTGNLRPFVFEQDYITRITAVAPAEHLSEDSLWLKFLQRVTDGDEALELFLQRIAGYSLTGEINEECLFFFYGCGQNGKSKFLGALSWVLNEYHRVAPITALMSTAQETHPTELAGLHAARLVTAIETKGGKSWDESKIKSLTGADPLTARFMRGDFFDFIPKFKILVAANHKPGLRTIDTAMRRRLHLIPFKVEIPANERDKDPVSYTHLRAHETRHDLVCRLLLE